MTNQNTIIHKQDNMGADYYVVIDSKGKVITASYRIVDLYPYITRGQA